MTRIAARPIVARTLPPARAGAAPRPAGGTDWGRRPLTAAFRYAGVPLPDISAARTWKPGNPRPTGVDANLTVTATYQALDQAMTGYLGEPALPNWMTFGKYASREAGAQIQRLEETLKVVRRLDTGALFDSLQDFAKNTRTLGDQGLALLELSGSPMAFVANVGKLRDALVYGNTGVYADVAPAYDLFLRTEAAGRDGVAALKAAGFGAAPRDPQGLLLQAFVLYQQAGRNRATLASTDRTALVNRANMLIVSHEQMIVVQNPKVFGDPAIARLMAAFTPQMTVTDARGTRRLLPNGGSWADFATRMGFVEAAPGTPGAYHITDWAGVAHDYVVNPDPTKRAGTISDYFASALNARDARLMIDATPAPLPSPTDGRNGFVASLRGWVVDALAALLHRGASLLGASS